VEEFGPGLILLAMGLVTAVVLGVGAAIGWGIVSGWRDRERHRSPV
jgi:hypothetical protein